MAIDSGEKKKIIIIGAGIAGLSAGVYAQMNGYSSQIYEMHNVPGGLMTAWKRKGFTIDGCIHWLTGSSKKYGSYYKLWEEVGLIQGREIFDPEVFFRYESKSGQTIKFYTDIDRLEEHLISLAPDDKAPIQEFCNTSRAIQSIIQPEGTGIFKKGWAIFKSLPGLMRFPIWVKTDFARYSEKYKTPLMREFFHDLWDSKMSAAALLFTTSMLDKKTAGYPIGGSLPMARAVEDRYCSLGGKIHYSSRVNKILVENNRAVGIRLENGLEERADYVISAADGHATIFDMLEGRYISDSIRKAYDSNPIFPALVMIGLGVNREFPEIEQMTGGMSFALNEPIIVAGKPIHRLEMMIYNFDPTMAPKGKTVVTLMVYSELAYWKELKERDPEKYDAEKEQVALEVINRIDQKFPGFAGQVEMADVATPVTFVNYTGNWQGSFEGWLPTPDTITKPLPAKLPGLDHFWMIGQWVQPGGGLPTGVATGREAVKAICKRDGKKFRAFRNELQEGMLAKVG